MPARIRERDLVIPALRAAAERPGGEISTSALIKELEDEFQPEGTDAETLDGRNDTYFSQKVRNLVSHRGTGTSMFSKGYATYDSAAESIKITDAGRQFLEAVPQE
ncbi:MAG: hypothetical protein K5799_11925 [Erythrobacter sp.]|nr:hypothetical protein [Erythrobacter sp.]